jgi:hypothetical protein
MRYLQLSFLLLLFAAVCCALPTRPPGIHHPSANSSASQFDPNGAAAWAKVHFPHASSRWHIMANSFLTNSSLLHAFRPELLERMLRLRVQPRHCSRWTTPPSPPPFVVRLALIVISLPNRRLPQAITPVGARTRLAAAARLSSAPPSSKVRLSPNSLARVRYVNVLHNSLLDQGGGWDGTFYYKSANPPPLTLLQACLHASFHASFLPLMPLSPISCCSFLSFLKSSPYWSSVGGIAAGPPLSTFFVDSFCPNSAPQHIQSPTREEQPQSPSGYLHVSLHSIVPRKLQH